MLTARRREAGQAAADELKASCSGARVQFAELDITSPESVAGFAAWAKRELPHGIAVLVNNAGAVCAQLQPAWGLRLSACVLQVSPSRATPLALKRPSRCVSLHSSFPALSTAMQVITESALQTLDTNLYGTAQTTEALLPLMSRGSRVVNVVSGAGKLRFLKKPELVQAFQVCCCAHC